MVFALPSNTPSLQLYTLSANRATSLPFFPPSSIFLAPPYPPTLPFPPLRPIDTFLLPSFLPSFLPFFLPSFSMSDSAYITLSRHRSDLSSSLLSSSAGFGPSGGGHNFVPPGRPSALDLIDDAWVAATLPPSTLDVTAHEHALPAHLTEADSAMPSPRSHSMPTKSNPSTAGAGSGGIGDVGSADCQQGFNRYVNGGFFGTGEVHTGGAQWGGQGPRYTEELERWGETGLDGLDIRQS